MQGKSDELTLLLGGEASFQGKLTFKGTAKIDSKFDGEILSEDKLIVGERGIINAETKVATVIVMGQVNGDVSATKRIEIHSTGKLYGNIDTPVLAIREGGFLDGSCSMTKEPERATSTVMPITEVRKT